MAITQILVDGVALENIETPVKVTLSGSGAHSVKYVLDTDTIASETFKDCDIHKITIPDAVKTIKSDAFKNSKVTDIILLGTSEKVLGAEAIPENVTLTVHSSVENRFTNYNVLVAQPKSNVFQSSCKVGDMLYEASDGTLYNAEYDYANNDTILGICVIPKGMFDNTAHYIGLVDIAYNEYGAVKKVEDYYEDWMLWNPVVGNFEYWWLSGIECYSLIPYIGLRCKNGEENGEIEYSTMEEMPDLLHGDRMYYTNDVYEHFLYKPMGVLNWSDKSRTHEVHCSSTSHDHNKGIFYLGSGYDLETVRPIQYLVESGTSEGATWSYAREYYMPSPFLQLTNSDEVTANPILLIDLPKSSLTGDKGNPFTYTKSANEFLIPNIISKCTKPQSTDEDSYNRGEPYKYGTKNGGTPTFFPAPYCCYEYAPGTGGTQHQWALGTPLEWACTFENRTLILNSLSYCDSYHNIQNSSYGYYLGGLLSNEGMPFMYNGNQMTIINVVGCTQPRIKTRPFIVVDVPTRNTKEIPHVKLKLQISELSGLAMYNGLYGAVDTGQIYKISNKGATTLFVDLCSAVCSETVASLDIEGLTLDPNDLKLYACTETYVNVSDNTITSQYYGARGTDDSEELRNCDKHAIIEIDPYDGSSSIVGLVPRVLTYTQRNKGLEGITYYRTIDGKKQFFLGNLADPVEIILWQSDGLVLATATLDIKEIADLDYKNNILYVLVSKTIDHTAKVYQYTVTYSEGNLTLTLIKESNIGNPAGGCYIAEDGTPNPEITEVLGRTTSLVNMDSELNDGDGENPEAICVIGDTSQDKVYIGCDMGDSETPFSDGCSRLYTFKKSLVL